MASGDRISEAVRVATIMGHAPDAVKSMLRLSPLEQRRCVEAVDTRAMPRLDSSKGRCRCKLEMSAMAAKARRVRANPPETRTRNATTGTMVSGKRNCSDIVHIARSGATYVRIVQLDWLNRRMVQWLAFKNLNLKLRMSKQHNGVTSTVKT